MLLRPNLIIPGSQKCGTSSLYYYLDAHPECVMSVPKEPSVFCHRDYLHRLERYNQCYRLIENKSRQNVPIVGEATTAYMVDENAPARICESLGKEVKFIFLLRNPVDRCISAYWHLFKRGDEKRHINAVINRRCNNINEAIALEEKHLNLSSMNGNIVLKRYKDRYDDQLWPFRYIRNSLYVRYITRYEKYYDRSQIFFVITEEMARQPEITFHGIARFLGINTNYVPPIVGKKFNRTFVPQMDRYVKMMRRLSVYEPIQYLKRQLPGLDKLTHAISHRVKNKIDDELKKYLSRLFLPEVEQLSCLLNRDMVLMWKMKI